MRKHRSLVNSLAALLSVVLLAAPAAAVPLPFSPYTFDTVQICLKNNDGGETYNLQLFSSGIRHSTDSGSGSSLGPLVSLTCDISIPANSCTNKIYQKFISDLAAKTSLYSEVVCTQAPTQFCGYAVVNQKYCNGGWVAACTDKAPPADLSAIITNSVNNECDSATATTWIIVGSVIGGVLGVAALVGLGILVYAKCFR